VEVDHPDRGAFLMPGWPVRMADSEPVVTAAPVLGQHTDEVLESVLGLDPEEIAALRQESVL
jgi:formyl-CoA transferase